MRLLLLFPLRLLLLQSSRLKNPVGFLLAWMDLFTGRRLIFDVFFIHEIGRVFRKRGRRNKELREREIEKEKEKER